MPTTEEILKSNEAFFKAVDAVKEAAMLENASIEDVLANIALFIQIKKSQPCQK